MHAIEQMRDDLRTYAAKLDPATHLGDDAARLTEVGAEIAKLAETVTMLFAKRAVDSGGWRSRSHAASPEQWLSKLTGCSEHAARETLRTADRVAELPATEELLRSGTLSLDQAAQVTAGAAVDPGAEARLLKVAERRGFKELRMTKERVVTAASDEDRLRRIAHEERHLRTWVQGYATHGTFSGPTAEVHELLQALEPLSRARFEEARRSGEHENHGAYRFDALIQLAAQGSDAQPATRPAPRARVVVGLQRLLSEEATGVEDVCEIPGVGPVPVSLAREVLAHGLLDVVITDGVDIHTVVSRTRHVPEALKVAIEHRSGGRCEVDGCDRSLGIERHHVQAFAEHHLTSYDVLVDVCDEHHDLVHYEGFELWRDEDGTFKLRMPERSTDAA